MSITGEPGQPPVRVGVPQADMVAGMFTAIAILAALEERHKSGQGQLIDISLLDCQVSIMENAFMRYFASGKVPGPLGTRNPTVTPFQAFQTRDGYIVVALLGGDHGHWELFCAVLDRVDLIYDPRFETNELRCQNYEHLERIMSAIMKTRTSQEWLEELRQAGIPCGPVNSVDVVALDPQLEHRQMLIDIDVPGLGPTRVINCPINLSRTPARVQRSCPGLGEHTQELLSSLLGMTVDEIAKVASGSGL